VILVRRCSARRLRLRIAEPRDRRDRAPRSRCVDGSAAWTTVALRSSLRAPTCIDATPIGLADHADANAAASTS